jgi:hypothetical protein
VRIGFPTYLLKVLDKVLTARIDQHPMLARMVAQAVRED